MQQRKEPPSRARPAAAQPTNRAGPNSYLRGVEDTIRCDCADPRPTPTSPRGLPASASQSGGWAGRGERRLGLTSLLGLSGETGEPTSGEVGMNAHPFFSPCPTTSTTTDPEQPRFRLVCSVQPRASFLLWPVQRGVWGGAPPGRQGREERGSPATSLGHGLAHGTHHWALTALWGRPDSSACSIWHSSLSTPRLGGTARRPLCSAQVSPALGPRRPLLECPAICVPSASRTQCRYHLLRRQLFPDPFARHLALTLTWWLIGSLLIWLPGEHLEGRQQRLRPCPQGPAHSLQFGQP